MNLSQVKPGEKFIFDAIPKKLVPQLIRFGFSTGKSATCISKLPQGPVVLQDERGLCQVALGHNYASDININRM